MTMSDLDIDQLAAGLESFLPPEKAAGQTAEEARVIAGFEVIQSFVARHGRLPRVEGARDIFERIYAVRWGRIKGSPEHRALVEPLDHQGLLEERGQTAQGEAVDVDALAELLMGEGLEGGLGELKHVRSHEVRQAAEAAQRQAAAELANRKRCKDFKRFRPLFEQVQGEVETGLRQARRIQAGEREIEQGDFFVLGGLTLYVAEVGPLLKKTAGEADRRLRVIYSNGTESDLLLRSLQRAFYDDPGARRLASPEGGQLTLGGTLEPEDVGSGTIYVLRSLSEHPQIAENRALIHKIGVTGGRVETRIANAEHEATYLLAKVEVVALYTLVGINRTRLERLLHRIFAPARLNITIQDRFGKPVQPEEWFLVPLAVINEAVERIKDGSITSYVYDPTVAGLVLG